METNAPLAGIKILDLTRLLPGPFCTSLLADLGAEVVKVEDPQGGDHMRLMPPLVKQQSATFLHLNHNKRSVTLDLKNEAGRSVLRRLLAHYDVLLEGFRPGFMAKLGLDYKALRADCPSLIYASLSGYGQSGPYAQRAGHDLNYMAVAGGAGLNRAPDGQPIFPGFQLADLSGGLYLALAVMAAVMRRRQTGEGACLDVAMTDCVRAMHLVQFAEYFQAGQSSSPSYPFSGKFVCYNLYRTRDDRYMSLCALEPKFWIDFCRAVDSEHLLDEAFSSADPNNPVKKELDDLFAKHSQAEWAAFFSQYDCCCEPVLDLAEAEAHPQAAQRAAIREFVHPQEGPIKKIVSPIRFKPAVPDRGLPAPRLGEHTGQVMREIGLEQNEIDELRRQGAFGQKTE